MLNSIIYSLIFIKYLYNFLNLQIVIFSNVLYKNLYQEYAYTLNLNSMFK